MGMKLNDGVDLAAVSSRDWKVVPVPVPPM